MLTVLLASHLAAGAGAATIQGAPLHNAASPGVAIPACGLGTGGYGNEKVSRGPACIYALPAKRFASESRSIALPNVPESDRPCQVRPQGVYPECWTDGKPVADGTVPHPGIDCSGRLQRDADLAQGHLYEGGAATTPHPTLCDIGHPYGSL